MGSSWWRSVSLCAVGVLSGCGGSAYMGSGPAPSPTPSSLVITTIAGTGVLGNSGDGGPATSARLNQPDCVVGDAKGTLYIGDVIASRVRRIDGATGVITDFAGNGTPGYGGDGGPATQSMNYGPTGCVLDAVGNLYFSDDGNNVVRRVDAATGVITTVVGTGFGTGPYHEGDFFGDGGPATAAHLNKPFGLVVDAAGNLYVSDTDNQRVRRVDAVTRIITTVAGTGTYGYTGHGGPGVFAEIANPEQLAVDASGNVYIAEQASCVISKLDAKTGVLSTVAGMGPCGNGSGTGRYVTGDGGPATQALLDMPEGVAVDAHGNVWVADSGNERVREVLASSGVIQTVVGTTVGYSGDGGPPDKAQLHDPRGLWFDGAGDLYIADAYNSTVRKVTGLP